MEIKNYMRKFEGVALFSFAVCIQTVHANPASLYAYDIQYQITGEDQKGFKAQYTMIHSRI